MSIPPQKAGKQTHTFSILAGWFIDGTGNPVQKDMVLESSEGMITSIRRVGEYDNNCGDLIDYTNYTIMPALVDSHAHLSLSGTENPEIRKNQSSALYHKVENVISGHLNEHLKHGIIAVRDAGDHAGHSLRYRRENKDRIPVIISLPGIAWHAPGRYGDFIGRTPSGSLAESILKEHQGIDHVKIINSGINSLKYFGKETEPQFDYRELCEAVRVCKMLGLKTMVHANGKKAVETSLRAGCDSIEHGFLMGRDNIELMAEKGVTWVPTLFPMKAYSRFLPKGSAESDNANHYLDHQMEQVISAHKYGVPIALGTDSGSIGVHHGQAVKEEMRLFVSAGLSIENSVRCASANGAELMGFDNKTGRLAPGFPSTFLSVKGAPEKFLNSPHPPEMVFMKGKKIHSPATHRTQE